MCDFAADADAAEQFDSLKVLFEPFEDRFHRFICPLPIHVEVYAAFEGEELLRFLSLPIQNISVISLEHVVLSLNEENWCWRHLVNNLFRLVAQPPINGC